MLARKSRLSAQDLRRARWQHEKKTRLFTVRWAVAAAPPCRYAVSVPLRVSKAAPTRNRLRRLVFAALRATVAPQNHDAIFIIHSHAVAASPHELQAAVRESVEHIITTP